MLIYVRCLACVLAGLAIVAALSSGSRAASPTQVPTEAKVGSTQQTPITEQTSQSAGDNSERTAEEDFATLRVKRQTLDREIKDIDAEIKGRLSDQVYWLGAAANDQKDLDKAMAEKNTARITELQRKIADEKRAAATDASLEDVKKEKADKERELLKLKTNSEQVEDEMNRILDIEKPKQEFKTKISFYFTNLVGVLIGGFFFIAWYDETVRREIFKGQAGIQFVTLFLLVVAIILFGITGILEGKELSALLGGLSGYILGRQTSTGTTSATAPPASTPPNSATPAAAST